LHAQQAINAVAGAASPKAAPSATAPATAANLGALDCCETGGDATGAAVTGSAVITLSGTSGTEGELTETSIWPKCRFKNPAKDFCKNPAKDFCKNPAKDFCYRMVPLDANLGILGVGRKVRRFKSSVEHRHDPAGALQLR
jgi:hypothetical protein